MKSRGFASLCLVALVLLSMGLWCFLDRGAAKEGGRQRASAPLESLPPAPASIAGANDRIATRPYSAGDLPGGDHGTGALEGRVLDEQGNPVGACGIVMADPVDSKEREALTSSSDGTFESRVVAGAEEDVLLIARKPGFRTFARALRRIAKKDGRYQVVLDRSLRLSGVVTDTDRRPIPDALVTLRQGRGGAPMAAVNSPPLVSGDLPRAEYRVSTDGEGRFAFEALIPGNYRIHAAKDRLEPCGFRFRPDGRKEPDPLDRVIPNPRMETDSLILGEKRYFALAIEGEEGKPLPHARATSWAHGLLIRDPREAFPTPAGEPPAGLVFGVTFRESAPANPFLVMVADGYETKQVVPTIRGWPSGAAGFECEPVRMTRDSRNAVVPVTVEVEGPSWTKAIPVIELRIIELATPTTNPGPPLTVRQTCAVKLHEGRGRIDLKTGVYSVHPVQPLSVFRSVTRLELFPSGENRLVLSTNARGAAMRVTCRSPLDQPLGLSRVDVIRMKGDQRQDVTPVFASLADCRQVVLHLPPGEYLVRAVPEPGYVVRQEERITIPDEAATRLFESPFRSDWDLR